MVCKMTAVGKGIKLSIVTATTWVCQCCLFIRSGICIDELKDLEAVSMSLTRPFCGSMSVSSIEVIGCDGGPHMKVVTLHGS